MSCLPTGCECSEAWLHYYDCDCLGIYLFYKVIEE